MTQQSATATPETAKTSRRVQKVGRVVSDKMDKTRVVVVESLKKHRIYKRTYKQTKRFHVHDEKNLSQLGDLIRIEECRPMSKLKRWRLVEIVKRGSGIVPVDEALAQVNPDLAEPAATDETEGEITTHDSATDASESR
jgi:small subunit ribosomal protein S17